MAVTDPLITFPELQARPGFENVDQVTAEALIEDASALVRDIADPVDLDPEVGVPGAITPVVVSMVRRAVGNPFGRTGEQLGDYGWQAQSGGGSGTIYATRNEQRIIRRAVKKFGPRAVTLRSPYSGETLLEELFD